jgi:hypothetical protein
LRNTLMELAISSNVFKRVIYSSGLHAAPLAGGQRMESAASTITLPRSLVPTHGGAKQSHSPQPGSPIAFGIICDDLRVRASMLCSIACLDRAANRPPRATSTWRPLSRITAASLDDHPRAPIGSGRKKCGN